MVKWLHKILFVAISISFFISATEMDLGEVHNTFFDEYDTYVKTEQVSIDQASITQPQQDAYALLYSVFFCCKVLGLQQTVILHQPEDYYNHYPPKLFLRNSVWRI